MTPLMIKVKTFKNQTSKNLKLQTFENQTSRSLKNKGQEVYKSNANNNNINNNGELKSVGQSSAPPNVENADNEKDERQTKTEKLTFSEMLGVIGVDWQYMMDEPPTAEENFRDWDDEDRNVNSAAFRIA